MAPKHHPTPLSGGDRKALKKELSKSRAMTRIFAERSAEKRRGGEALIREADNLACQSWNERMWSDGGPIDPSPTIDQAINGGYCTEHPRCYFVGTYMMHNGSGVVMTQSFNGSTASDCGPKHFLQNGPLRAIIAVLARSPFRPGSITT
jgi:hypothetical protein